MRARSGAVEPPRKKTGREIAGNRAAAEVIRERGPGGLAIGRDHLGRDRDILGRSLGRSARQGQEGNPPRPGQVFEDGISIAQVVIPERFIRSDRDLR